jgi:DeoR/GlpR family transcriptional regulator of sugar metabolism
MQKIDQRKKELLDMLLVSESVSVNEAAQRLGISLPTARRLCAQLADEGRVTRVRGGIRHLAPGKSAYSFDSLRNEHVEEKMRIAKYASRLVQSNQVIFVEAGTTLRHFSIALAERIRNQEITNVVIFTNSLINLDILYPVQSNIQMIGGQYRDERKEFVGYLSELSLKGLRFNYCVVGADAVSIAGGVMAMDMDTVRFDAELVTHAEKTVILAHSEKFKKNSLISYVSVSQVDCIITDSGLEKEIAEEYFRKNVSLITV